MRRNELPARFNGLTIRRLKPAMGKDVETPYITIRQPNPAVNDGANCRETPLGKVLFYMNVQEQIKKYIASQPEPKRAEMQALHDMILQGDPAAKLWFLDGKDANGKVVSNPNIGYGSRDHKYADGSTSKFYQIGLSANKTGISVYILGIEDKKYLAETYAKTIGKASVTGYCIRFKALKDINTDVLEAAIGFGFENTNEKVLADVLAAINEPVQSPKHRNSNA
ncbi:MAG: DUF1801 domain-containing protein [Pyrinomonadaceae bacterium]